MWWVASGLGLIRTPLDDHWKFDGNAGREWVPAVWPGRAAACAAPGAPAARAEPASSAHTAAALRSVRRLTSIPGGHCEAFPGLGAPGLRSVSAGGRYRPRVSCGWGSTDFPELDGRVCACCFLIPHRVLIRWIMTLSIVLSRVLPARRRADGRLAGDYSTARMDRGSCGSAEVREGAAYFLNPAGSSQRRYEAMRAYFTEDMPASEAARPVRVLHRQRPPDGDLAAQGQAGPVH